MRHYYSGPLRHRVHHQASENNNALQQIYFLYSAWSSGPSHVLSAFYPPSTHAFKRKKLLCTEHLPFRPSISTV